MPIIKTQDISYTYSVGTPYQKTAVDHVNLEIEEGEFVGVIGHTGSGKSTLIQHLNGLLAPTEGKVFIDGQDVWADKAKRHEIRFKVGLVFQYPEYQLFEDTVFKDIAFGPKNMGLSEQEIKERVLEAANFVGLKAATLDKSPFELSGGQKRRVAIAGVIAMRPRVLILDEPTAGLDPRGRRKILGQIQAYHKQEKNTVLLVSHSMEDVAEYATKVLVMNKSHLFAYDTVDTVFSKIEELKGMGLSVPQLSSVFYELKQRGFEVNTNIYTVEQAKKELMRMLSKGGRPC